MFRLDPDTFKKLHPNEFHRRFLGKGVRPDGREGLLSWRAPSVHKGAISTCNGSALVRLGGTTVICGIKAEVCVPDTNRPNEGYLVPNVDFPPLCSSQFKPTAPGEFTQSVSELVYRVVKGNNILPLESLCIAPGKAAWVLYADIIFLNYEGNPLDAALLALAAALKDTKLPRVAHNELEGSVRIVSEDENAGGLGMTRVPLSATFGVFESEPGAGGAPAKANAPSLLLMADPTDEEETVLQSSVTVVVDALSGDLMGTFGGAHVSPTLMDECVVLSRRRVAEAFKSF